MTIRRITSRHIFEGLFYLWLFVVVFFAAFVFCSNADAQEFIGSSKIHSVELSAEDGSLSIVHIVYRGTSSLATNPPITIINKEALKYIFRAKDGVIVLDEIIKGKYFQETSSPERWEFPEKEPLKDAISEKEEIKAKKETKAENQNASSSKTEDKKAISGEAISPNSNNNPEAIETDVPSN